MKRISCIILLIVLVGALVAGCSSTPAAKTPTPTASALESTSAAADPTKTESFEAPVEAKETVASWVLSPSSARKTVTKVESAILRSMGFPGASL